MSHIETVRLYSEICGLAHKLSSYGTTRSVQESYKLFSMCFLSFRKDICYTRTHIVHTLLALGMDQKAYDFVKLFPDKGSYLFEYGTADKLIEVVNYRNCDRSDPIINMSGYPLSSFIHSALVLIKYRLYHSCLLKELFLHALLGKPSRCGAYSTLSLLAGNIFHFVLFVILLSIQYCLSVFLFDHQLLFISS
jgi:hypothetical protein